MEASTAALGLQSGCWIGGEKPGRKASAGFLRIQNVQLEERRIQAGSLQFQSGRISIRSRKIQPVVTCCQSSKSASGAETLQKRGDGVLLLKKKSQDVLAPLDGRCIYLVGMMGSGKTTVGKIIGEVLGYSVFDSDKLVEQAVGMPSVAQIFKVHSETFFRNNESEVLKDLSSMKRLVVATGGGAVIRPINWRYMKEGISIWLDVPLDALARRIAAVGTASRPLLDQESGDPYSKAFAKLSGLIEQRYDAYANADVRVSLEEMANKKGHDDVCTLTPIDIAIEALQKIERLLG